MVTMEPHTDITVLYNDVWLEGGIIKVMLVL